MKNKTKFSLIKKIYTRAEIPTFLKLLGLTDSICELGVATGGYLWPLIVHSRPRYCLAIDVWDEEVCPYYPQAKHDRNYAHVQKIFRKVEQWAGTSLDVIKGDHDLLVDNYEDESFDFIYIDTDHSYEVTESCIRLWWPKVKKGGILAGHDYNSRNKLYGVVEAVDEFVEANNIQYFHTTSEYPKSWMILKDE